MSRGTDSSRGPQISAAEAAELTQARERMLARHKLIEKMIHNNERQLKNESARGGAEIERECAIRDAAAPGAGSDAKHAVETLTQKLRGLEEEHQRLVAEREWLNASLLQFENGPSAGEHEKAGHA